MIYPTIEQKTLLSKASRIIGKSMNFIVLDSLGQWLNRHQNLRETAKDYGDTMKEIEAKNCERDTGDLLGSFKKRKKKLRRIDQAYREGNITKTELVRLKELTNKNYDVTTEVKKSRILRSSVKSKEKGIPPKDMTSERRQKVQHFRFTWLQRHGCG